MLFFSYDWSYQKIFGFKNCSINLQSSEFLWHGFIHILFFVIKSNFFRESNLRRNIRIKICRRYIVFVPGKSAKNSRSLSVLRFASTIQGRHQSKCRINGNSQGTGDQGDQGACNRSTFGSTNRWWNRPLRDPQMSILMDMLSCLSGILAATHPANCFNISPCNIHLLLSVQPCRGDVLF